MALRCFDVAKPDDRPDLLLVYQSDFLAHLDSRLVVPLLDLEHHPTRGVIKLNPVFEIENRRYVMWTQSLFAADNNEIGRFYAALDHERDAIRDAFDFLTTGF